MDSLDVDLANATERLSKRMKRIANMFPDANQAARGLHRLSSAACSSRISIQLKPKITKVNRP